MPNNLYPLNRPLRIAITLGDPAGIGPEIVLRLFEQYAFPEKTIPFVVGEARHLEQVGKSLGLHHRTNVLETPPDTPFSQTEGIPVIEPGDFEFEGRLIQGEISPKCGQAAWSYVCQAVELIQKGLADAVVTAPLHKEALHAAGCPFPGHTEILAHLAGDVPVAMLLVGGGLRVALATIHEPLSRVSGLLTKEGILAKLKLMDLFIPWFGISRPRARIGVTGLNPHAGEGGLFGQEEKTIIAPAIEMAHDAGLDVLGPLPADTIFHFQREGIYDAVLAMTHDQALIPVKTLDFHRGVNVTMGLPFIRTSVDHGTAFNIAGKGIARADSLISALECAIVLAHNRRNIETL
jgi:4-hydroxythreonine-4-phosphate dehydrogenase